MGDEAKKRLALSNGQSFMQKPDAKVGSEADLKKSKDEPGTMQSEETTLAETEHK